MAFKKTDIQLAASRLFGSIAREFLLLGGSRSGKSFIIIYSIIVIALRYPGSRHLVARFRFNHVKNSIWADTLKKVLQLCFPGLEVHWNHTDHVIKFPNGSEIWIAGLDDKERIEKILGMEFLTIFLNEASQISYAAYNMVKTRLAQKVVVEIEGVMVEARRRMFIDENPPSKRHWTYDIFFNNLEPIGRTRLDSNNYAHLKMNPDQNLENIGVDYMEILATLPLSQQKRFKDGDFSDDSLDALWTSLLIGKLRVENPPAMKRICVAIDPAVTSTEGSDETGIMVEGLGYDNHLYILEDLSGKYTPNEWATISVQAYHDFKADVIVGEANNGGDLIEAVVKGVDKYVKYKKVTATRDKRTRAEPVAAVYERGEAHHVGENLLTLETEMTTWAGKKGEASPNRIDALVWGAAELLPLMAKRPASSPRATPVPAQ